MDAMLIDDVTDLHVHGAPSLVPRHGTDQETVGANRQLGVTLSVLKAHEGSTVERAASCDEGVLGGIVLNSVVGGANPDAVEVAARLGGRIVWLPTWSSAAHLRHATAPELSVHRGLAFREVPVVVEGRLLPAWHEVLEVVAAHDLVLASGHLSCVETVVVFRAAREHGVRRLLVNHPMMPFLGWEQELGRQLRDLDAHVELAVLPDLLAGAQGPTSLDLLEVYPRELMVFGGDLGHADHPALPEALPAWLAGLVAAAGDGSAEAIMTTQGRRLLLG